MFRELKEKYDQDLERELGKTGIFYAFNNEQFEENRTYKETSEDKDYLKVFGGAFIHKNDREKLDNYATIKKEIKQEFLNKINIADLIEYELINHECYYTDEWYDIVPIINDYLDNTKDMTEDVKRVYNDTKEKN